MSSSSPAPAPGALASRGSLAQPLSAGEQLLSTPDGPDDELPAPAALLPALLQLLPNGVIYYLPVYAADGATVTDFRFRHLNAAAQRMLGLPEQPAVTYLEQFPGSVVSGAFAFHRDAWAAGSAPTDFEQFHRADGYVSCPEIS